MINMLLFKKYCSVLVLLMVIGSCKKIEYNIGSLTAPNEVTINTKIAGQDAANPNGNGSGDVEITLTGKNVLSYNIDYDASDGISMVFLDKGKTTRKYTKIGLNTYRITVVAFGAGGTATTVTKDI